MRMAVRLNDKLRTPDAQQYLTLYLVTLLFALLATWPSPGGGPNDTWFSLAYVRAGALGLLGLGYGMSAARAGRAEQRDDGLMLVCFAVLGLPLEIAGYAASYPATPLPWALALPALTAAAMFALGLLFGELLALVRMRFLAPLLVPALLAGMVAFDVAVGRNVLNPFTGAVRVSLPHLAVLCGATLALVAVLLRPAGRVR